MDIKHLNPTPRWSDATVHNGIAHFVEVPADTSQSMEGQIHQVLSQAELTLAAINSHKSRLLSATIYVTSPVLLETLNTAWEDWLPFGSAPSRACLIVGLVDSSMLVEIAFVAAVNPS